MAMNKKEKAEMERLEDELRLAKAWRRTEPVTRDVCPPSYNDPFLALSKGWDYAGGIGSKRVERCCSSQINHSFGQDDKTTSQGSRELFSSKLRALRAARYEVEQECAKILANLDRQIEQEESGA